MRISICGNIGSGKTTLLEHLKTDGYKIYYEPVEKWTFLSHFYKNMKEWAFKLQVQVLFSFLQTEEQTGKLEIYERSPFESLYIFAYSLYQQKFMTHEEYSLIHKMTHQLAWKPDIIIYLRSNPELCLERIKRRNRESERGGISITYLKHLHDLYEERFSNNSDYIVDASLLKEEIYDKVQDILNATVSGTSAGTCERK